MKNNSLFLVVALTIFLAASSFSMADVAGSADHPLVKRITDSKIFFSSKADFGQLKLALEKIEWSGAEAKVKPYKSATVEGRLLTNYYQLPEKILVLEALRNYEQELREGGFEILFSGQGEEIETVGYNNQIAREILKMFGTYGTPEEKAQWPFQHTEERKAGYLAARKTTAKGDVYVSVYLVSNTHANWQGIPVDRTLVRLDVCERKAREQRMELVKSEEMESAISLNGRIALYGILFDFDKATLQADSESTLSETARLLEDKKELRILVVGHTDASGSFDYNRQLSQKRAETVVADLIRRGIAKERLFPVGVSFASPVATNGSEDGRAKNRRVELVDMASGKVEN